MHFRVVVHNAVGPDAISAGALLTVHVAPSILTNPSPVTVTAPNQAVFAVTAAGDPTLTYQWQRDQVNISGATNASYTLTPTQVSDNGHSFRVVVTNPYGQATSTAALLTVNSSGGGGGGAPFSYFGSFSRYPTSDNGSSGSPSTVAITPPGGMSSGQLAVVVTLYRSTGNKGQTVDVSAAGGQTWHSEPAFLTPSGELYARVFWCEFNGTWSANPSFVVNSGGGSVDAYTLYGLVFNAAPGVGIDVPFSAVSVSGSSLSHGGIAPTVNGALVLAGVGQIRAATLSGWTSGWTNANGESQWRNARGNDSVLGVAYRIAPAGPTGTVGAMSSESKAGTAFMIAFRNPPGGPAVPPSITTGPQPVTVTAPAQAPFTVLAAGNPPLTYQWQRNGVDILGATGASYTLLSTQGSDNGAVFRVVVDNASHTPATSAAALLTVHVAPSITTDPQPVTVTEGAQAQFTVAAAGDPTLTYQWQREGLDILGATSASYTIAATQLSDNGGHFRVVVTNAFGNVTSAAALLTVNTVPVPPSITTGPQPVTVTAPAQAPFTVLAAGDPPLTYQWQRNGVDILGATGASYTLLSTQGSDNGAVFRVVVDNASHTPATSAAALLTVHVAPSITTDPQPVTVTEGAQAQFTVAAAGDPTLTYQWQREGLDILGATSASYTIAATQLSDNGGHFRVVVTNAFGNVTSAAALLTVNTVPVPPSITTGPQPVTVTAPAQAPFTVLAAGDPPLTYQWQRNGVDILGATGASYTLLSTQGSDNGAVFRVVVDNASHTPATSAAALLTVHVAPSITTDPQPVTVTEGAQAQFAGGGGRGSDAHLSVAAGRAWTFWARPARRPRSPRPSSATMAGTSGWW